MKTDGIQQNLSGIRKLDTKQRELEFKARAISSTSAVGQPPPILGRLYDKIIKIMEQKADIWNKMRGAVIGPNYETLWQLAVKKLPVRRFGKETILAFYAEDIEALFPQKACP